MSITQIQNKLYNYNFKSEEIRRNSYLAVHASISKNKEVPRTYIEKHITQSSLINNINDLFLTNCSQIVKSTNDYLKLLNISTSFIDSLSYHEKSELLQSIEYILENGWGSGMIYYEKMRITPFTECHIVQEIQKQNLSFEPVDKLISILKRRYHQSKEFKASLENVFSSGSRKYHASVLSRSYEMLLEKNWRNSWMHHSNYSINNDFFENLIIVKDIE